MLCANFADTNPIHADDAVLWLHPLLIVCEQISQLDRTLNDFTYMFYSKILFLF